MPESNVGSETTEWAESPLHGFRGSFSSVPAKAWPRSLSIAVSREAGARGGAIAKRVGQKLGWQVYSQELLEYITQEGSLRQELLDQNAGSALDWVEDQLDSLRKQGRLGDNATITELARIVLTLGSQGDVILVGRGAGCILPTPTTLHVCLIAPLHDRIAYISESSRLTMDEAAELVEKRDRRRQEFLETHFRHDPSDFHEYDLILNSSRLGEETCAYLIAHAAKVKMQSLGRLA